MHKPPIFTALFLPSAMFVLPIDEEKIVFCSKLPFYP